MKPIFFLLILFAGIRYGFGQKPGSINDWTFFTLKGEVRTLTIQQFKAKQSGNGKIEAGVYIQHPNGVIANKGDMQDSLVFNEDGYLSECFYFPYTFNDINFFTRQKYVYDDTNRITEMDVLSVNRSIANVRKEKMLYDAQGRLSDLFQSFDTASVPTYHYVYTYTTDPLVFNAASYSTRIGLLKYYTYRMDSLTRLISVTSYNKDSTKDFTTPMRLNEWLYEMKNSADDIRNREYNEYFYDDQGNWVKMISYSNGKPVYILKRSIVYFE